MNWNWLMHLVKMIIWNITSSYEKKCTISLTVSIYFNNNVYACLPIIPVPTSFKHFLLFLWGEFFRVPSRCWNYKILPRHNYTHVFTNIFTAMTWCTIWKKLKRFLKCFKSINTLLFIHLTFIIYLPDPLSLNWFFVFLLFDKKIYSSHC